MYRVWPFQCGLSITANLYTTLCNTIQKFSGREKGTSAYSAAEHVALCLVLSIPDKASLSGRLYTNEWLQSIVPPAMLGFSAHCMPILSTWNYVVEQ